jgi:hypothetical protein
MSGKRRTASEIRNATKLDHGQVFDRPLSSIQPAPDNDKLYRPISSSDPEIVALAESIRQHGLREPLVITLDGVILSGHRRYAACGLAGLETVRCRFESIFSTDPAFLSLLREYNRQRVKSIDELVREEIISANPEESHRLLLEHRRRRARVSVNTLVIEGEKCRHKISAAKTPFLEAILQVLRERNDFWPLTDRQIHYALLNDPPLIHAKKPGSVYKNDQKSYRATIDLVTRARLEGLIEFDAIHDPTRPVTVWRVHREASTFIRGELDGFLKNYYRDLQQSQPNHLEIVVEKNTVSNIVEPVAMEYCIPTTSGRGYSSLPPRYEMAERFRRSGKERLVLLVASDFDPEGQDIAHSLARSMRDDFGVIKIEPIKVALTASQVTEMNLPPMMKAKETSSRYGKFTERYGDNVFELEAIPPERLQTILRASIDAVLDVKAFNAEIDAEKREAARLDGIRRSMTKVLSELVPQQ